MKIETTPLWNAKDVAKFLGMSLSWVQKQTIAGEVPHVRLGERAVRYDPAAIQAWLSERTITPTTTKGR